MLHQENFIVACFSEIPGLPTSNKCQCNKHFDDLFRNNRCPKLDLIKHANYCIYLHVQLYTLFGTYLCAIGYCSDDCQLAIVLSYRNSLFNYSIPTYNFLLVQFLLLLTIRQSILFMSYYSFIIFSSLSAICFLSVVIS